jgi:hypothetical protein
VGCLDGGNFGDGISPLGEGVEAIPGPPDSVVKRQIWQTLRAI